MKLSCVLILSLGAPIWAADVQETVYVAVGAPWRYAKGTTAPPANWNERDFDDSSWLQGPTGIGYGDGDDATVLSDMQGTYLSVFMRYTFTVDEPRAVTALEFTAIYDDGFAAYLNGTEIARENLPENATYDTAAPDGAEPVPFSKDLGSFLPELVAGDNVLAIQVHNVSLNSSDLSMIPALSGQVITGLTPFSRGDVNADGQVTVSDATYALRYLFEDGAAPSCPDAADADDNGRLNLVDVVYLLTALYLAGPPLPEPRNCGVDLTWEGEDPLLADCDYAPCR